ncbi:hypothetical protein CRENBAI_000796 [Crenichthys baileyi]|uniref:Uncharacterized protein n=1 Tax=Crenichthys baileyi TaxID=28760 RepID=A0AAV9R436_9TELE
MLGAHTGGPPSPSEDLFIAASCASDVTAAEESAQEGLVIFTADADRNDHLSGGEEEDKRSPGEEAPHRRWQVLTAAPGDLREPSHRSEQQGLPTLTNTAQPEQSTSTLRATMASLSDCCVKVALR